ncbi:MAG TPA: OmpW family outer membrane protein, partial [Acidobacteriota bacterium]|nr:OmpW family outer membrane protein [Acidobacteriota bacterium]
RSLPDRIRQVGALLPTSDDTLGVTATKARPAIKLESDSALAFGVSYERRISDLFGLEAAIKYSKPNFKATAEDFEKSKQAEALESKTRITPLTVAALFHPLRDKNGKVDLFVGPELVYAMYGSSDTFMGTVDYKNQLTWGVKAGIDYAINARWAFTASAEYMDLKAEIDESGLDGKINPKPVFVVVGAACKF